MVLVAVGDFDHQEMLDRLSNTFGSWSGAPG
ncbi:MAG: hypothetical protein HC935_03155, partial [Pseudanabaena sp. SU_2_4]|nr:hypothetical protein [Pseudanabaena sp. SU_2_4]